MGGLEVDPGVCALGKAGDPEPGGETSFSIRDRRKSVRHEELELGIELKNVEHFQKLGQLKGWMWKSGVSFMSTWKRRYFVQDEGSLHYFLTDDDPVPKGHIDLWQLTDVKQTKVGFDLHTSQRIYRCKTDSKEEADRWVSGLHRWLLWANPDYAHGKPPATTRPSSNVLSLPISTRLRSASTPTTPQWLEPRNDNPLASTCPVVDCEKEGTKEHRGYCARHAAEEGISSKAEATTVELKHQESLHEDTPADKRLQSELRKVREETGQYYKRKLKATRQVMEEKDKLLAERDQQLRALQADLARLNGVTAHVLPPEELDKLEEHLVRVLVKVREQRGRRLGQREEEQQQKKMSDHRNGRPDEEPCPTSPAAVGRRDLCQPCIESPRAVAFVPCGHSGTCAACAEGLAACRRCGAAIKRREF